jgi:diguanylate cyclase (GGDEF)-like protein
MKILAAANSDQRLSMLTSSLQKLGHEVVGVNTEQVIESCGRVCPDFMIIDATLQPWSSVECVQKIRRIKTDLTLPVIFLINSLEDELILQKITASGDDFLLQPLNDIILAAKIIALKRLVEIQKSLYEATYQLSLLSSIDTLTGISNRLQFDKALKEHINAAKLCRKQVALLFLDLDNFKEINDHLGHHIGDLLLKEVANRLKQCLGKGTFIARLGGDEFAIILNHITQSQDANPIAEKVVAALKPLYTLEGFDLHISCSIGIACYPTAGDSPELLTQCADAAMYEAKGLGRNNYQHHQADLLIQHKERFLLENALNFALDNNELFIHYQPIFQIHTRKIIGMEALMRWKNPKFGLVPPDIFIPIAEATGLIIPIGQWALKEVCQQAQFWHRAGYKGFKLSVNISSRQLVHKELIKDIKQLLDETNLPAKLLDFELTESTLMASSSMVESIIKELSDMKIGISLDDFGTGYSSLSHLKRLPITALKIDKTFIKDAIKEPNDALIVQSIISLGKMLKINVIAEGIENAAQLQFLIQHGCQQGQGFYFSEPLSSEAIKTYLEQG